MPECYQTLWASRVQNRHTRMKNKSFIILLSRYQQGVSALYDIRESCDVTKQFPEMEHEEFIERLHTDTLWKRVMV